MVLAVYVLLAVASTLGAFAGWNRPVAGSFAGPCPEAWLGTDRLGRSVLLQLGHGARTSLSVVLLATVLSTGAGALMALAAGTRRRWIDEGVLAVSGVFGSVPGILLLLGAAFALRDARPLGVPLAGVPATVLALALTGWVGTYRVVRVEVMQQVEREYVLAARALGLPWHRVLVGHVLPNCAHLLLLQGTLRATSAVHAEVLLGFLGLGPTDRPTWGGMLEQARFDMMQGAWWQVVGAGGVVFVLSLALNVLGEALRDTLDP